jgi:Na+/proline symporter/signal transduction histidine kinase/CheY-like chemotaxis protein
MFEGWAIVALAVAYVVVLFFIAWFGDRANFKGRDTRPFIYALSLAVYCTSWTFFGSVGLAANTGYDFIPVYIGPILMFTVGLPLVVRVVRIAKSQNITSVADFLAARHGKSPAVAAIVTVVAVAGTLPYIALQLKAIITSTETLLGASRLMPLELPQIGFLEMALVAAFGLATFAVLFGTRHIDATEHQDGLMLAVAAESVVKLVAFLAVGLFAVFMVFGDPHLFADKVRASDEIARTFGRPFHGGNWLTVTFLSFCAIILLPRQFHVTVVENHSEHEIRRAGWLFPLYLVLINLFVVPIAMAGMLVLPRDVVDPDMFVLGLPMAEGSDLITTFAYVGGLSAATAMVVVESIALSIMVCNGLVVPLLLRGRLIDDVLDDLTGHLLIIRRIAIFAILFAGYGVYSALGQSHGLATIGLISFAAIAQLAPAFFIGLLWRKGTAQGAIAGILAGFAVWAYTLLLPWVVKAGLMPPDILDHGPLGIGMLRPQVLFYLDFEPLTHGVVWSMAANISAYIAVSLLRPPEPVERLQANVFIADEMPRVTPAFRLWRTSVTIGDLQATVARYLGAERAERSFAEYVQGRRDAIDSGSEADVQVLRFTEHLLTSAIGAASARLVLSLLLRRTNVSSPSALKLLDDASEALQYNRDLLQSALDQVRHGLGVFDSDMRLICWNRQFRELLGLPLELGRVGVPLAQILRTCAERGDFGEGPIDELVADRLMRLAVTRETYQERLDGGARILEIRTSAMPQGGIVTTFLDITDRIEAQQALARANETLERRVRERTAELTELNRALALAKSKTEETSLDKTRFLAAASHDLLQPLNAARLYATSLIERRPDEPIGGIARNIDASLSAVEDILSALIDLSRMDAGRLEPEIGIVPVQEIIDSLALEFEPLAREKGLRLKIVPSSLWVKTDRRLAKRVMQNLVSNAVKYTRSGGVVVGARRRGNRVVLEVHDTGPGIGKADQAIVFKEFQRLAAGQDEVRGLGLGLSIVDRIGRVLSAPIGLQSVQGHGSTFSFTLPLVSDVGRGLATRPIDEPQLGALTDMIVLAIDNEPAVLAGMRTLLSGWQCEVVTAAALEDIPPALTALAARGRMPDLVLADYHLDNGTGIDAVDLVRQTAGVEIPAVIITADHSPEVQRALRKRGLLMLRKPIKAAALRSVMMRYRPQRQAAE